MFRLLDPIGVDGEVVKIAVPGFCPIHVDSNDADTVFAGFVKRLGRQLPVGDRSLLRQFHRFVLSYIKDFPILAPLTFQEWLDSTSFNELRKAQLMDAFNSLKGGLPNSRQCSHIDTFVKTECYDRLKHARLINSRCDVVKVTFGPYAKSLENWIYHNDHHFIKHVPIPDRPKLIRGLRRGGMRYFVTDYTAFESHFVSSFMDICECELYRHCFPLMGEWFSQVIMGKNRLHTRKGIRAQLIGRRMSGEVVTSLGNGFTNLMLTLFLSKIQGRVIDGFVEGDDGIFCTNGPLNPKDYERLGFTIKIKEVSDPCFGSFCGLVCGESGEIIRDPISFIAKFGWTHSFVTGGRRIMGELLRAKALSTIYETPQCPIVSVVAHYALDKTSNYNPRFIDDGYHISPDVLNVPKFCPSYDTRLLFANLYGIPIMVQLEIERLIMVGNFQKVSQLLPLNKDMLWFSDRYIEIT